MKPHFVICLWKEEPDPKSGIAPDGNNGVYFATDLNKAKQKAEGWLHKSRRPIYLYKFHSVVDFNCPPVWQKPEKGEAK